MSDLSALSDDQLIKVMEDNLYPTHDDMEARERFCDLLESEFSRRDMTETFDGILSRLQIPPIDFDFEGEAKRMGWEGVRAR